MIKKNPNILAVAVLAAFPLIVDMRSTDAQQLLQTMLPTPTSSQTFVSEGASVANNSLYVVTGKPYHDSAGFDSAGAVEIYDAIDFDHILTIVNPELGEYDIFGDVVAISGHILVVRAHLDDEGGSAYVFDLDSSTPSTPILKLQVDDPTGNESFAEAVDVQGNLVVAGAPVDRSIARGGSVFIYDLTETNPEVPILSIGNPADENIDRFGEAVSISNNLIFVGTPNGANSGRGRVFVFDLNSMDPRNPVLFIDSPEATNQWFGGSLDADGPILVVGDSQDFENGIKSGAAYVYDLDSPNPTTPLVELLTAAAATEHQFGISVSVAGSCVLVGEDHHQTSDATPGAAFFYDLTSATPGIPATVLVNPAPEPRDVFGRSVSMFGNIAIVGAPRVNELRGNANVYDCSSTNPETSIATLSQPSFLSSRQDFGQSIAVDGNLVVVGAGGDGTGARAAGAVFVYDQSLPNLTTPIAFLPNPDPNTEDFFGSSVSLSGNIVAVGASSDDTGGFLSGVAYVFDLESATPEVPILTLLNPTPADYDRFGFSVLVAERLVIVSSPGDGGFGTVYVHDLDAADPSTPLFTIPNPDADGSFGHSLAFSNAQLVVGRVNDDHVGSVFVYDFNSSDPTTPYLTITNPSPSGIGVWGFGFTCSISGDRLAVGAPGSTIDGEPAAGLAFLYDLSSPNPATPIWTFSNPTPVNNDKFGYSISVSGSKLVIGELDDDQFANEAGLAHVYDLDSPFPDVPISTLNSPSPSAGANFGWAVFSTGNTAFVGSPNASIFGLNSGAVFVFNAGPSVVAESFEVVKGIHKSGSVLSLAESDNSDLSVTRDSTLVQAIIELSVKGTSPNELPTSFAFSLEASVFARGEITQTIELFNYQTDDFEVVDERPASLFSDQVTIVEPSGDLSRFVQSGTRCTESRITFDSSLYRSQFTANIDQVIWEIE